jgi:predicted lipoprotein with Yx(FWY)xxD motif
MGAGLERHKRKSAHTAGWRRSRSQRWLPLWRGCGSGGIATRGTTRQAGTSPGAASSTTTAVVKAGRSTLGMILTNGKGRAVYLLEMDTGTEPSCYGACAAAWPPVLTTGHPVAGSAITAALLGTVRRTNGTLQVTCAGHPVYYFSADQKPGDISGGGTQAIGGGWDLVSQTGKQVEKPGG